MIYIFFPGGGFGSTIEYCIRRFSKEFETIETKILDDGSMHSYGKEFHPTSIDAFKNIRNSNSKICTPIYTLHSDISSNTDFSKTFKEFKDVITPDSKVIFIVLPKISMVEQNILFVYYKIILGIGIISIDELINSNLTAIKQWNPIYTCSNDMQRWEQRELLSLNIKNMIPEFLTAKDHKLENWLLITPDDILTNLPNTIRRIINYLNLTFIDDGIDEFYTQWRSKQQYILDRYQIIQDIVTNTLDKKYFIWKDLDLQLEAIIQYKLQAKGFNLKCFGLNKFPNTSENLYKLLVNIA